jgi:preprotein translocase subunit YajC
MLEDMIQYIIALVFVFALFAFLYLRHQKWQERSANQRQEMEAVARQVINDYGRVIIREELRKIENES